MTDSSNGVDWEKALDPADAMTVRAAAEQRAAADFDLALEFLEQLGLIGSEQDRMRTPQTF